MNESDSMVFAVYGSRRQHKNIENINRLFTLLSKRGVRLIFHSKLFSHLRELLGEEVNNWNIYSVTDGDSFCADLALSIGGDGTFLRTARWVAGKNIPIAGINAGHLGFLTSFDIENVDGFVNDLFNRRFRIESRAKIEVSFPDEPDREPEDALNEIVAIKGDTASMITVNAELDGAALASYLADGLIISTATGSTGYNLSVGGPVLQPLTPSFVITPIAAHSLTMRPLVVADSSVINLEITSRADSFLLCLDGRYSHLANGTRLVLRKSGKCVKILLPEKENFAAKIREKLLWGVR